MSRWQSADPWLNSFKKQAAVYAIYDSRRGLVYIGETNNLKRRFNGHNFILARYSLSYSCSSWPTQHFTDVNYEASQPAAQLSRFRRHDPPETL